MHLHLIEATLGATLALAFPAALATLSDNASPDRGPAIADIVEVTDSQIDYPRPGEFLAAGRPVASAIE